MIESSTFNWHCENTYWARQMAKFTGILEFGVFGFTQRPRITKLPFESTLSFEIIFKSVFHYFSYLTIFLILFKFISNQELPHLNQI